jgi:hypothetical protein
LDVALHHAAEHDLLESQMLESQKNKKDIVA